MKSDRLKDPRISKIGKISSEDQRLLTIRYLDAIKLFKKLFAVTMLLIIVIIGPIIGIIIAAAPTTALILISILALVLFNAILAMVCHVAIDKEKTKLNLIEEGNIDLYKVQGILTREFLGENYLVFWRDTRGYLDYIDGYRLPVTPTTVLNRELDKYVDRAITVEFYPSIFANRCHYDASGNGYNHITNTAINGPSK